MFQVKINKTRILRAFFEMAVRTDGHVHRVEVRSSPFFPNGTSQTAERKFGSELA
jgi:hypothetical protein